jgi:transposase
MQDAMLIPGTEPCGDVCGSVADAGERAGTARVLRADRAQTRLEACCLEDLIPEDHQARIVWAVVERLDLSAFYAAIAARGSEPGRPSIDPMLLTALWLYAAIDGVGNGRELARLCEAHAAYRWLCGGVGVSYHTLNDFRVGHSIALDELFTRVVATLSHRGIVTVTRLAQDGTRIRAAAGTSSFGLASTLHQRLDEARAHVRALKLQADDPGVTARESAARLRAADDRLARVEAALAELPLAQIPKQRPGKKPSRNRPARVSTTDPEARRMKMGDGGFRPAYNLQLAADTASRAIVGLTLTSSGTDSGLNEPMRKQVQARTGRHVAEHLTDGGYTLLSDIVDAAMKGTTIYRPPPPLQRGSTRADEFEPLPTDPPEVAAWRARMKTEQAAAIYRERASTIETINADLKEHRGLGRFRVRGIAKATCVALWAALAYNVLHFAPILTT